MRNLIVSGIVALFATNAWADESPMFSFGGDLDTSYAVDAERMTASITPELTFTPYTGLDLVTGTTFALYDDGVVINETLEVMPTLTFEAKYTLSGLDSVEWFAKTSYDLEIRDRGEISIGATFSF